MNLQNFYQKWQSKTVEDYGSCMSPSAKQFANNIKAVIKEIAINNGASLEWFNINHYDVSGMIKKGEKYVYFNRDIERYNKPINLDHNLLIRSAKHSKDFTGGRNNYCDLKSFESKMNRLLDKPELW